MNLATNTMESSSEHVDFVFGLLGETHRGFFKAVAHSHKSSLEFQAQHAEKATGQRE